MTRHTVAQGECLSSIAAQYKLLPDTIWNDPANAQLKNLRKSPNILLPGDVLQIPDITPKTVSRPTEQRHKFVRKGIPCKLRIRFRILESDGSHTDLANESFLLHLAGRSIRGSTDGNGRLRESLDPSLSDGRIVIRGRAIPLAFGNLDPHDSITGLQARLNQSGYNAGPVDGILGPRTRAALKKFQKDNSLSETGNPDAQTFDKLRQIHGS